MKSLKLTGLIILVGLVGFVGVASAFIGPSAGQNPGSGGGRLIIDSAGNIGFGSSSSTPASNFDATSTDSGSTSHGYVFMVASTTNPGVGIKNLSSGNVWLWSARNFGPLQLYRESTSLPGLVVMEVLPTGHIGVSTRATTTARFKVSGNVEATGSFVGGVSGAVVAGNVSSDVFGRLQGNGHFAFPANLGVATSSQSGLPQELSVYGDAYVSGNVGIGTASPGAPLHILGTDTLPVYVATTDTGASVRFLTGSTVSRGAIRYTSSGAEFLNAALNAINMIILDSGNVGIGTASPSSLLHMSTTAIAPIELRIEATSGNGAADSFLSLYGNDGVAGEKGRVMWNNANSDMEIYTTASKPLSLGTNNNPGELFIQSGGNVGIGTTNPQARLHVSSSGSPARFRGTYAIFFDTSDAQRGLFGNASDINVSDTGFAVYAYQSLFFYANDNSTAKLVISTSGNVGIADTTPTEGKLVVGGTGYFTGTVTVGTPTSGGHATTKSYVDSVVGGGGSAGSFTTLAVTGTSTLATGSGRVGIGTVNPTELLSIHPPSNAKSILSMQSTAGAGSVIHMGSGGEIKGGIGMAQNVAGALEFFTGGGGTIGSSRVTIGSTGNVGIGTTGPNRKLEVAGDIYLTSGGSVMIGNTGTNIYGDSSVMTFDVSSVGEVMRFNNTGNVGIATTTPAYKLHVYGTGAFSQPVIVGTPTGGTHATTKSYVDSVVTGGGGDASFNTVTVSGTSTLATGGGRVGIGTASPGYDLHINKATAELALQAPGTGTAERIWFISGAGPGGGDGGAEIRVHNSGDLNNSRAMIFMRRISTASGQNNVGDWPIAFWTSAIDSAATEKLRILGNGNVGIGTASPGEKLDVAGDIIFRYNALIADQATQTTNVDHIWADDGDATYGGNAIGTWHFSHDLGYKAAGNSALVAGNIWMLNSGHNNYIAGNVGIATTTPAYKLHVYGTGAFSQPVIVGTPTQTSHATTKSYVDSTVVSGSGWTDGGANVYLTTSGDSVGIGTGSPQGKLHVFTADSGSVTPHVQADELVLENNDFAGLTILSTSSASLHFGDDALAYSGQITYTHSSDEMRFFTNNTQALTIQGDQDVIINSGNVGIGDTNPTYKIEVDGSNDNLATFRTSNDGGRNLSFTYDTANNVHTITSDAASGVYFNTGNVGIGTVGPGASLELAEGKTLGFGAGDNTFFSGIGASISASSLGSGNAHLNFTTNQGGSGGGIRMTILNSGNVGIATTTPAYALQVYGTGAFSQPVVVGTPTGSTHAATKNYVDSTVVSGSGWTDGGANVYLTTAGDNVGIGTSGPGYGLDVNKGSAKVGGDFTGTIFRLEATDTAGSPATAVALQLHGYEDRAKGLFITDVNTSYEWFIGEGYDYGGIGIGYDTKTASLSEYASSTKFFVNSSGNVGIGTVSPGASLNVADESFLVGHTSFNAHGGGTHVAEITSNSPGTGVFYAGRRTAFRGFSVNSDGTVRIVADAISQTPLRIESTNTYAGAASTNADLAQFSGSFVASAGSANRSVINLIPTYNLTGTASGDIRGIYYNPTLTAVPGEHYFIYAGSGTNYFAGDVGIATTTPAYKLHVYGTGAFSQPVVVGTPTGDTHAATKSYVDSTVTGGGGDASFSTLSVSGTSTLATTDGQVGIGTSAPTAKLHLNVPDVAGTQTQLSLSLDTRQIWSFLRVQNQGLVLRPSKSDGGQSPWFCIQNSSGNGTCTSGILRVETDTNRVGINAAVSASSGSSLSVNGNLSVGSGYFTNAAPSNGAIIEGNVGIGTASPGLKLEVTGTIGVTNASGGAIVNEAAGDTNPTLIPDRSDLNTGIGYVAGNLKIIRGGVRVVEFDGSIVNLSNQDLVNVGDGSNDWTSTGLIVGVGSVGIATTSPAYALHVYGTGAFSQPVVVGTPTQASHAATKNYVDSTVLTGSGWTDGGSNVYLTTVGDSVGIGTASPVSKLQISGNRNALTAGSSDTNALNIGNSGSDYSGIGYNVEFTATSTYWQYRGNDKASLIDLYNGGFRFWGSPTVGSAGAQASLSTLVAIENDGDVGIGITNPSQRLDVEGGSVRVRSGSFTLGDQSANESPAVLFLGSNTATNWRIRQNDIVAGDLTFTPSTAGGGSTFTTPAVSISSGGNVGIGVTNPAEELTLAQDYYIRWGDADHRASILGSSGNDLRFQVGTVGNELVRFDGDTSRVGIATTTPAYKLHVYGTGAFSQPVVVGTPTVASHAATKNYVDSASVGNAESCNADATCEVNAIDANNGNITGVNKLTVTTIDPLYQIGGSKYSTYAASIVGGVKEEYVGRARLTRSGETYEHTIDFGNLNDGSDLWVWFKTVEFSENSVEAIATPYGQAASIYYVISGKELTFKGDKPAEFSYRLTGKRFDWKKWPTYAVDQNETPSFIIK